MIRVAVYCREQTKPHVDVADAVVTGALRAGEDAYIFGKDADPAQLAHVVIIFGIGGNAKEVWDTNPHARRILLDKPYVRGGKVEGKSRYHRLRVAVDAFQPLKYFQQIVRPGDRWKALGLPEPSPYKRQKGAILFDGASNKYCLWNGLGDWTEWGREVVAKIREHTDALIIYRPRPSHNVPGTMEVVGATFSDGPLLEDFMRSALVVSHGGNIGYDAAVLGIPHFAIGDSVARPISETRWKFVDTPRIPPARERQQWLNDLAYCQWTLDEFADGSAWRYVRETLDLVEHLAIRERIDATP